MTIGAQELLEHFNNSRLDVARALIKGTIPGAWDGWVSSVISDVHIAAAKVSIEFDLSQTPLWREK